MPDLSHATDRSVAAPTPEVAAPSPEKPLQPRGNEAAQEQVEPAPASGLANYQSSLGNFLGKKLYEAVADVLTYESLSGQAKDAVTKALGAMADQVGKLDGVEADPKALENLGAMLDAAAAPHLDKLLEKHGKELQGKLANWVGAHPRTVLSVALLAAAGAVVANMPIPELAKTFKLGKGLSASVTANLGKLRDVSLQKLQASLSYTAGPLVASIEADKEGTVSGGAALTFGDDDRQIKADGKFDQDGLTVIGLAGKLKLGEGRDVKGSVSQQRGKDAIGSVQLVRRDGKVTRTDDFSFDQNTGKLTVGESAIFKDGDYSLRTDMRGSNDGTSSAGLRVDAKQDDVSGYLGMSTTTSKGAYGLTEQQKLEFGLSYTKDDLKAKLDAALQTGGGSSLSGSIEQKWGNHRAGGSFSAVVDDPKTLELGAFYGFKDPKEFKAFLLEYKHKAKTSENVLSLLVEDTLWDVKFRFQQSATWGGKSGGSLDTKFHAAKFYGKDTALIGGFEHKYDFESGKNSFTPQVGVQYKGLPVMVGYDMEKKGVKIGITIPF